MSNIIINTTLSEKPICSPNRSLPQAMNQGPMTPPSPAKVKRTPRIVFPFSVCVSETAAVKVGKMTEKKKPVTGNRKKTSLGPNKPTTKQRMLPAVIKSIERK